MKKLGFTLAELLITLVIVGVIAALTIPQFITNANNQTNAAKLATVAADYQNVYGMMMMKENKTSIFETEFGSAWSNGNTAGMKSALAKYTKVARTGTSYNDLGYLAYSSSVLPAAWAGGWNDWTYIPNNGQCPGGNWVYEFGPNQSVPPYEGCQLKAKGGNKTTWCCPSSGCPTGSTWYPMTQSQSTPPEGMDCLTMTGPNMDGTRVFGWCCRSKTQPQQPEYPCGSEQAIQAGDYSTYSLFACQQDCEKHGWYWLGKANPSCVPSLCPTELPRVIYGSAQAPREDCKHGPYNSLKEYWCCPSGDCPIGYEKVKKEETAGRECQKWSSSNSDYVCCKIKEAPEPTTSSCTDDDVCAQGSECYDAEKCCSKYPNKCKKCKDGQHWNGKKCIRCKSGETWNEATLTCVGGGDEPTPDTPTPGEVTKTPIHTITNGEVTSDDVDFIFGTTAAEGGANVFYDSVKQYTDANGNKYKAATVYVDVNGKTSPNNLGRDVFAFVLTEDGQLHPYGSEKATKILQVADAPTWKTNNERYGCSGKGYKGLGCTGRLSENKFKVDY